MIWVILGGAIGFLAGSFTGAAIGVIVGCGVWVAREYGL